MGKKKMMMMTKLPFLSQNDTVQASWPWPSCQQQPKTLSFRADHETTTPKATIEDEYEDVESVIKGLKSERLFFEPGETKTSSIMEEATKLTPFKESVVLSMESRDPYIDFRESMEAMVEANQGLKNNWEGLEELLCWYLKANERDNHGYIFGAFVDLLVKPAVSSWSSSSTTKTTTTTTTTTTNNNHNKSNKNNNYIPSCSSSNPSSQSPSSPMSFYSSSSSSSSLCSSSSEDNSSTTTPCVSSLSDKKEIINEEDSKDDVSSPVIGI